MHLVAIVAGDRTADRVFVGLKTAMVTIGFSPRHHATGNIEPFTPKLRDSFVTEHLGHLTATPRYGGGVTPACSVMTP